MGAAPQEGGKGDESKGLGSGATTGVPMLSKEHHNGAEVNKSHHRHLFGFRRFGSKLHSTTPIPVVKALQKDTVKEKSQSRGHRFVTTVRNLIHLNRHFNESTKGNQTQHKRKWKKMLWKH